MTIAKSSYRILRVNLTDEYVETEAVSESIIHKFIGGKGLAAFYLYNELTPHVDPFSLENKLIFMLGPLTGVYPGFPRYTIVTKSPLTETFTDSYSGGAFPLELRKAGYIGIIIEGKADSLVFLQIDDDSVHIRDAQTLIGKTTVDVDEAFPGFHVAAIGVAGENLVRFACVMNDMGKKSGRSGAAGRGGTGAIMGSKNLKAIAVKGSNEIELSPLMKDLRKKLINRLINDSELREWTQVGGNLPLVDLIDYAQILPTHNFTRGSFEYIADINQDAVEKNFVKKQACPGCPVPCGEVIRARDGIFKGVEVQELEYETVAMCGSNCGQHELSTVMKVADLCDIHGLDTISTGATLAFAMECSEKGLIDYDIQYGDPLKQVELLKMIIKREGVGNILAEGVKRASEILGAEECAIQVKGLEIPAYDPRGSVGMALAYATSDRGGCHMRAWTVSDEALGEIDEFSIEGKAALVKHYQDLNAALWCLINCDNILNPDRFFVEDAVELLDSIGFNLTEKEFIRSGERICNLTHLFNVREGFSRIDDRIPMRFQESREDTGWKIDQHDFFKMLDEYYTLRGWDNHGIPKKETLQKLNLDLQ